MAKTIEELKAHFGRMVANQGCICESDYQEACTGITDLVLLAKLNVWLVSSNFKLRRGIGEQYKQELLQRINNPNVSDVKDTKHHTNPNRDKKQESKKEEEKKEASVTINKIIEKLKDLDTEDEFLPPWKKREASLLIEAGERIPMETFDGWKDWLVDYITTRNIPNKNEWVQFIKGVDNASELTKIWEQIYAGDYTSPIAKLPTEKKQQYKEYVDLPDAEDAELVLDKASSEEDPVDKHLAMIARSEYSSNIKKKIKFDNDTIFTVDIAETPAQKAAGLEVFNELTDRRGLLFTFDKPDHVTFHMGKVKFPIDILFFMKDDLGFRTAKIVHDINPGAVDLWSSPNTACVLEVLGGSCKRFGIGINSYCQISDRVEV